MYSCTERIYYYIKYKYYNIFYKKKIYDEELQNDDNNYEFV